MIGASIVIEMRFRLLREVLFPRGLGSGEWHADRGMVLRVGLVG